jgi:hypothetical protein
MRQVLELEIQYPGLNATWGPREIVERLPGKKGRRETKQFRNIK